MEKYEADRIEVEAIPPLPTDDLVKTDQNAQAARAAADVEHRMGLIESARMYPKAILFSVIMSLGIVMEGYDTALLGNFFAQPAFQLKFGHLADNGTHQVSAPWQAGLGNGAAIGEICGLWAAGLLADKYGYKRTLMGAMVFLIGAIFICFFAVNIPMLFVGEILCGLPWGALQTLTTTYAADVTPIHLRHVMTSYVNLCWVAGQLISSGVLRAFVDNTTQWGWKIPYAIQWVWPVPILIGIAFAPESPYWLVRQGRENDARKALLALTSEKNIHFNVDDTVAMMIHTNEHERQISEGTSYLDCFKGVDGRRTEIACMAWISQVTCGIWFGGNITYFLEQAGFDPKKSFDFGVGENALGFCATILSWYVMTRIGRRTLFVTGIWTLFTILCLVGFLGIPKLSPAIGYSQGALMCLYVLTYDLTVGPTVYTIVSEIPSSRLRIKTVVIARNAYNVASIVANELNAPILNPTAWNLRGKGGFVWCGFCLISAVWAYFRLPETKGLSYEELDILFENKVPAKSFKSSHVEAYQPGEVVRG
ncbi:general substrate transporter [Kockovaella imperatae]|uniref:General substrate transporter n=1 Tax=Kockovaella imperatae TaxID=4999 RepID=A0A1Y1UJ09_9TREE|nr:general substrate transporter [Kockovaella imperatae]ORX38048.1 general substrate transporter [Kockovaella imperatae]